MRGLWVTPLLFVFAFTTSCTSYRWAKEIKMVAFSDDVHKGKSIGEIEGDDCIYMVLGYRLGGRPQVGRAIRNASKQKKSSIGDSMGGGESGGEGVRYINNLSVKPDGFNAVVFGKDCFAVTGLGFK